MQQDKQRRMLPFVVEFVKFSTGFAVIITIALLALHFIDVSGFDSLAG